jgi:hypothetical protein
MTADSDPDETPRDESPRDETNRAQGTSRPPGATPPPGARHPDPPLPETGRQSQRPGQHGRYQDRPGARDEETLKSEEVEGFGPAGGVATNRGNTDDGTNAATRRSSVARTSGRHDHGVGSEEPPPRPSKG